MKSTSILLASLATFAMSTAAADTKKVTPAPMRLEISVTGKGFAPDKLTVAAAQPVTLVFTRKTDKTCAKQVVIQLGDGKTIEKDLPLDKPIEVTTRFAKAGELKYACSMDMISGVITVQ